MISVRRTNGLPQASFRFHLTMDTLALLAMCFPLTGALRTFTFKNNVRAGRTDILPRLQRRGLPFAKSEPSVLVRWHHCVKHKRAIPVCPTVFSILLSLQAVHKTHTLIPDIDCSIDIPVMVCTAFRTDPCTDSQILRFGILIPAYTAQLAACKETAYFHQLFSLFFHFVLQEIHKYPPAVIQNGFAKVQRLWHCFHIEIFYTDAIIRICNLSRLFV